MDWGIKISGLEQLEKDLSKYKFAYFGSEFCENKIPSFDFCKRVFDFCKVHNKIPVLLTSFLSDKGVAKIKELIVKLVEMQQFFEVTINDLGLLEFLSSFDSIKVNCGRLLVKMKKGPEISSGVLDSKTDFRSNSLNNPLFLEFFKKLNVSRFEVDIPPQGISLPNNENISLYVGNLVISVTRRCPFIDCFSKNYSYSIKDCTKECLSVCVAKNTEFYDEMIYMFGNAELLKTDKVVSEELKGCFDRIVVFASVKDVI